MNNIITIIYSIIPVISLIAGIFIGFYMAKEQEIPTPRKVYKKHKEEKENERKEKQDKIEQDELEDYIKAIDEYGV